MSHSAQSNDNKKVPKKDRGYFLQIPIVFIDESAEEMSATAISAYLRFCRRFGYKGSFTGSRRTLCKALHVARMTLGKIITCWEDLGLMKKSEEGDILTLQIMDLWKRNVEYSRSLKQNSTGLNLDQSSDNTNSTDDSTDKNLDQPGLDLGHDGSNLGRDGLDLDQNRANVSPDSSSNSALDNKNISEDYLEDREEDPTEAPTSQTTEDPSLSVHSQNDSLRNCPLTVATFLSLIEESKIVKLPLCSQIGYEQWRERVETPISQIWEWANKQVADLPDHGWDITQGRFVSRDAKAWEHAWIGTSYMCLGSPYWADKSPVLKNVAKHIDSQYKEAIKNNWEPPTRVVYDGPQMPQEEEPYDEEADTPTEPSLSIVRPPEPEPEQITEEQSGGITEAKRGQSEGIEEMRCMSLGETEELAAEIWEAYPMLSLCSGQVTDDGYVLLIEYGPDRWARFERPEDWWECPPCDLELFIDYGCELIEAAQVVAPQQQFACVG